MSRSRYTEHIIIDIISAYAPGIPIQSAPTPQNPSPPTSFPISFYYPGDSVLTTQLSAFPIFHSDPIFTCYQCNNLIKITLNPLNIISLEPKQLFNSLPQELISRISTSKEILLGMMDYPKSEYLDIERSVYIFIKGIEFLNNKVEECKITIATVNYFYRDLESWLKNRLLAKRETYHLNKDMRHDLYDKINCKFCRETPTEAYVTDCCTLICCENCKKIMKNCYGCGISPVSLTKEPFYNQFIKDIDYKCKCDVVVKCGTVKEHSFICELTVFKCKSVSQCKFEGTQVELVVHAIKEHSSEFDASQLEIDLNNQEFKQECPPCLNYSKGNCPNCPPFQKFEEILELLQINNEIAY